jgi:hypothetical protein
LIAVSPVDQSSPDDKGKAINRNEGHQHDGDGHLTSYAESLRLASVNHPRGSNEPYARDRDKCNPDKHECRALSAAEGTRQVESAGAVLFGARTRPSPLAHCGDLAQSGRNLC